MCCWYCLYCTPCTACDVLPVLYCLSYTACPALQLKHEVWPQGLCEPLQQIIHLARLAASLQPDGTGMPEVGAWRVHWPHCCSAAYVLAFFIKNPQNVHMHKGVATACEALHVWLPVKQGSAITLRGAA